MRLIQHNPVQAWIEEYLPQSQIEKSPLKCLSQQAKQYLVIGQQLTQFDLSLKEQIADLAFVGWRVRLFLQLFIENPWGFQIDRGGIADLKSCLDRFKDLKHYRIGGVKEKSSLFEIEKQEVISVKRNQAKAKDYLNKAIMQDVFAFRLVFSYQPNIAFITEDNVTAFNALFTDFLKNLKRTRRISGESLVAYVGTRIFIANVLNADITLIFSAQNLSDYDEQKNEECIKRSRTKVIEYWQKYLSIKELKSSKSKNASTVQHLYRKVFKDENLRISQSALVTSLPRAPDLIHIKHHDSKTLRSFKSELADFYSGHGLLCKWKSDVLENFTPSDEGHSSKSMDQFLKGHVVSDKPKQSKPKKETVQNRIRAEMENLVEGEDIPDSKQHIPVDDQAALDTVPATPVYVLPLKKSGIVIKRKTKPAPIPKVEP